MINNQETENKGNKRNRRGPAKEKWSERVVQINRVTKVCKTLCYNGL